MKIQIKRVYEAPSDDDGVRILVDKMWPRGIKKADLAYDIWQKDISPSVPLRQLLHQDSEANWDAFAAQYRQELAASEAFAQFVDSLRERHPVAITLLFAFRNKAHNHAQVLKEALSAALNDE